MSTTHIVQVPNGLTLEITESSCLLDLEVITGEDAGGKESFIIGEDLTALQAVKIALDILKIAGYAGELSPELENIAHAVPYISEEEDGEIHVDQ